MAAYAATKWSRRHRRGADPVRGRDQVATIWVNRPEVKKCVNWALLTQLGAALDRAEDDPDVRVVLIRGRGHTFCAGADLN